MSGDSPKGWMGRCTMKAPVSTPKIGRVEKTIARISRIPGQGAREANKLRWRFQDIRRLKRNIRSWEEVAREKDVFEKPTQPGSLPIVYDIPPDEQIRYAKTAIWSHVKQIEKSITYWSSRLADLDAP